MIEIDKIDLMLCMSGGFLLMLVMWWYGLNKRIDSENLNKRIDSENFNKRIDVLECKIEKLDERLTDVERFLWRLEGAFASKDCCMIKEDKHLRNNNIFQ